jgi:hypothetical protein
MTPEEIASLIERVRELETAKWEVQHVDTMNDMVLMGMARDAADDRVKVLEETLRQVYVAICNRYYFAARQTARAALKDTNNQEGGA